MLRKHTILISVIIAVVLLLTAMRFYPGGSQADKNSIGYSWTNNYISNLFAPRAVNGADNTARYWAVAGMLFNSIAFAVFYIGFSKRIPAKGAAAVIRYFGIGSMLAAFLTVTPYHDIMVTVSCTCALVSMFYIMVFAFKSKLYLAGILSTICLAVFYFSTYLYYTSSFLELLPTMQKLDFATAIIWMLYLHYFTDAVDFSRGKDRTKETSH